MRFVVVLRIRDGWLAAGASAGPGELVVTVDTANDTHARALAEHRNPRYRAVSAEPEPRPVAA